VIEIDATRRRAFFARRIIQFFQASARLEDLRAKSCNRETNYWGYILWVADRVTVSAADILGKKLPAIRQYSATELAKNADKHRLIHCFRGPPNFHIALGMKRDSQYVPVYRQKHPSVSQSAIAARSAMKTLLSVQDGAADYGVRQAAAMLPKISLDLVVVGSWLRTF
jgi:hypothetical protein